jgi:ATP synthase F1 gamma subunit
MANSNEEIDYLNSFSYLIAAYEEIAANRMQQIREKVLYGRDYIGGLNNIFQQLKYSYHKQAEQIKKKVVSQKNDKTACVFISANSGLYGDLVARILHLFLEDLKREAGDAVIIGSWGKNLFELNSNNSPYVYFDLPDSGLDLEQINHIVGFLKNYRRVIVYHGLFRNIIKQDVVWSNISGDQLGPEVLLSQTARIIYEPSLEVLMNFFEKEIFSSLFTQSIYESQLAKFSARMTALDTASQNIDRAKKMAILNASREKHRAMNKKQLASLTGRLI